MADAPPHLSPTMAAAWARFDAGVADLRRLIFSQPWMDRPDAQKAGHYLAAQMLAVGYNLAVAPRPDTPVFFSHLYTEPTTYCWGLKTPDFLTRFAYVDGSRTYRIWGRRKSSSWLEFTVYGRYLTEGAENVTHLGTRDFDDLTIGPDGAFEIIASATPHEGDWLRLDADSGYNAIHLRELFTDWETQETLEIHIEAIDERPARSLLYDEAEMASRLEGSIHLMRAIVQRMVIDVSDAILSKVGLNAFYVDDMPAKLGTNPRARYLNALYEIAPDEALIIEADLSGAGYWSFLVGDAWMQALDFMNRPSSLNARQAHADADGKVRVVLALTDPGVPNWLEAIGGTFGYLLLRWYFGGEAVVPAIRRVPLAQLRDHLPPDTPTVTADQRRVALQARRRAGLRRYDY